MYMAISDYLELEVVTLHFLSMVHTVQLSINREEVVQGKSKIIDGFHSYSVFMKII